MNKIEEMKETLDTLRTFNISYRKDVDSIKERIATLKAKMAASGY